MAEPPDNVRGATTVDNDAAAELSTGVAVDNRSPPKGRNKRASVVPPKAEKTAGSRMRIVAYARVSTDKQTEEGISLDAQAARFRAYAVAQDVDLVDTLSDSLSGKDTRRPGLQRALAMLENGEADGLLVTKLDRLTRSVLDGEALVDKYFSGRFVLLTLTGSIDTRTIYGRFVFRIMMSFAQFERELISERTKEALAHARSQGGGTPRLEGAAAARCLELAATGLSLRAIAARLLEERVPTLKGGKWGAETVRKILARAK